jgi:hypothetical protein
MKWNERLYPKASVAELSSRPVIGRVACQEYSAVFQVALFRLDLGHIAQPVLDIGCGQHGLLVRHLLKRNIEAYGIDRWNKGRSAHLEEADWIEKDFEPERWGTVISNMAFSNHYAFVHRFTPELIGRYTERYERILNSLVTGGSFLYGPGAPDLEKAADANRFSDERCMADAHHSITRVPKIRVGVA